jgi:crotonobetainyl-CoA:carnitine CoA-transferase CaiB-like acyl-CoA transferase
MGAVMLSYGVLAALMARERHGIGQEVNASHLGSMMMLQGLGVSAHLMLGFALPRTFRAKAKNPLWNHYRCADDKWLALGMPQPDRVWADFCRAVGREDLIEDERCTDMRTRAKHGEALVAVLDEVFAARPRDEWMACLRESPGDFIYTRVNAIEDLPEDPQVQANDYIVEVDHPEHGKTRMMGMPVQLSETPGQVRSVAPEHGQHTEEVLLDVLGWDWERISALREAGAI